MSDNVPVEPALTPEAEVFVVLDSPAYGQTLVVGVFRSLERAKLQCESDYRANGERLSWEWVEAVDAVDTIYGTSAGFRDPNNDLLTCYTVQIVRAELEGNFAHGE